MKKVELLAPAGNYEALKGALCAGADAVYLGGSEFGARAYAENFTQQELCEGISYAHTFNRKIYLTVNTLIKEKEFDTLYTFLAPAHEAGLDGVIVQDLGGLSFIRNYFPELSLHASTQMTITGALSCSLLKEEGISRVVPSRELSLEEIKEIKNKTGLEIETFIHGAMCYCYSGQCLFSSILGGRSGNRGRCAQPCRLPYQIGESSSATYPLSMKDMCMIDRLPELIRAGIDSFKIEGRMKKPEYAAGVTAIYRRAIDAYYYSEENNCQFEKISRKDRETLNALYLRSAKSEGYYHQYNGKAMITLSSPAYTPVPEELLTQIRKAHLEEELHLPVHMQAVLKQKEAARLSLTGGGKQVTVTGDVVQKAEKQPLTKEQIEKQLSKNGGTCFSLSSLKVEAEKDIFMPVSALNKLRREGLCQLQKAVMAGYGFSVSDRICLPYLPKESKRKSCAVKTPALHVLVTTGEQLKAALDQKAERIYLDRLSVSKDLLLQLSLYREKENCRFYLAFPYIVRKKDLPRLEERYRLLQHPVFDGALARNLETIAFLEGKGCQKKVVSDTNLYVWNSYAYSILQKRAGECYLPVELNAGEIAQLKSASETDTGFSQMIYGRLPLMISAGCILRTSDSCSGKSGWCSLTDRYQKQFPVYHDCIYCYNIIYNSVPLSLHRMFGEKSSFSRNLRLDFTTETETETGQVISYFRKLSEGQYEEPFYTEFTAGHYKRGVE